MQEPHERTRPFLRGAQETNLWTAHYMSFWSCDAQLQHLLLALLAATVSAFTMTIAIMMASCNIFYATITTKMIILHENRNSRMRRRRPINDISDLIHQVPVFGVHLWKNTQFSASLERKVHLRMQRFYQ